MTTVQLFLLALFLIYIVPLSIWKFGRTDYFAPLVTIQILVGIVMGPGILGHLSQETYQIIFSPSVIQLLNGLAFWGVMIFVFLAGIELDLQGLKNKKTDTLIANIFAIGVPLIFGSICAIFLMKTFPDLAGPKASTWQFALGIGMASAVTALPILVLFMEKLKILRLPFGQRILRYASLGDIFLWSILGVILLDWTRLQLELLFLLTYFLAGFYFRKIIPKLKYDEKIYASLIWLILCALGADYCGMHFMVGAFLAGAFLEIDWFKKEKIDSLRLHVLILLMPIFFLSTGLKTHWELDSSIVIGIALIIFFVQLLGKFIGIKIAASLLGWKKGESSIVAWLLQTKALIEIIFVNILLDKEIISNQMFTVMLLMALISTMCTIPMVMPKLKKALQTKLTD
jgi:Kef-type K+ transport system membrane component KefB